MSIRKSLFLTISCFASLLAIGSVCAYPWHGLSYIERWREMRSGRIYYSAHTTRRVVALTFDDGPDPRYTGTVLKILRKHHVKATFFLCGKMLERNQELGRQIVADGHVVGNHTETHPHLESMAGNSARREVDDCEREIETVTGERTYLFRPPRGLWNAAAFDDARRHGYSVILWSLAFDRQAIKDSTILRRRIARLAKPGDIILMHDGSTDPKADIRRPTLRELDGILSDLEKRGFSFATVPELLHIRGDQPLGIPAARFTPPIF
jgi:peptidoglycan/xylan/chitin deacetylase (PgdA/CDA1 family)